MVATSHLWLFNLNLNEFKLNKILNSVPQSHQPHFKCSKVTGGQWIPYLLDSTQKTEHLHHLRKFYCTECVYNNGNQCIKHLSKRGNEQQTTLLSFQRPGVGKVHLYFLKPDKQFPLNIEKPNPEGPPHLFCGHRWQKYVQINIIFVNTFLQVCNIKVLNWQGQRYYTE